MPQKSHFIDYNDFIKPQLLEAMLKDIKKFQYQIGDHWIGQYCCIHAGYDRRFRSDNFYFSYSFNPEIQPCRKEMRIPTVSLPRIPQCI